ncbi:hypothetical protein JKP88DRAFT_248773 [Tribonema minus]|uniref:Uncharacterized protein n=1 Tax=Tribonema minus TaxID=303371 RepID=A0A835YPZ6_9STRA|nr:hypothetical protein JKP88DRAFT_248773 [Tribonema minus]
MIGAAAGSAEAPASTAVTVAGIASALVPPIATSAAAMLQHAETAAALIGAAPLVAHSAASAVNTPVSAAHAAAAPRSAVAPVLSAITSSRHADIGTIYSKCNFCSKPNNTYFTTSRAAACGAVSVTFTKGALLSETSLGPTGHQQYQQLLVNEYQYCVLKLANSCCTRVWESQILRESNELRNSDMSLQERSLYSKN